ncbi:lipid-A-disaccharide synthase [Primorskyibacter sp. S187A]|uniref:lipid-A-disaccharide synthase n=1 Tax=Primorskyibacter sp. S187A TaxID=3415130 RepID=UPI003C7A0337
MRLFLLAGEPSADRLGAALMRGLRELTDDQVSFAGVGGPLMEAEGLESLFPMDEISIMGITEILSQWGALMRRIDETAQAVVDMQPDALITIDLPEFSLRLAKKVKAMSAIRCVHYVAPTVWAWRPGRAEKMARHIDQVLALLPFEPPYMEAAGMRCDFVGHPVVTEPVASEAEVQNLRASLGVGAAPLALVLPGSRRGEVGRLAPIFGEVLGKVHAARPDIEVLVPAAPAVRELVAEAVSHWPSPVHVIDSAQLEQKRAAFRAADFALAASGTVSLELAASSTPMVIAYDMNWLSRQIIGRMLRVDTVTLVNLVSERRDVPEFIGAHCKPELIAQALLALADQDGAQADAMDLTMERLGRGAEAPGRRAARAVLDGLSHHAH